VRPVVRFGPRDMPGTREWVLDIIRLLLRLREEQFPFEREVKLFELQTWAHLPQVAIEKEEPPVRVRDARALVAARLLRHIESGQRKAFSSELGTARYSASLLKMHEYQALFDAVIAPRGGFLTLLETITPSDFDVLMKSYVEQITVVADLMDYRFRYLDHGGKDKNLSNLSHAYVYRFNDKARGRTLSGKTIRVRWQEFKKQAIFIYVSQKSSLYFFPKRLNDPNFTQGIIDQANDLRSLKEYFGKCAYVSERVPSNVDEWLAPDTLNDCFPEPAALPRVRLETEALPTTPDGQIPGLENYEKDYMWFRDH
jgi:hypothetical protein